MTDNLTLKEHLLITEADEDRKRRKDLTYTEEYTKKLVSKVIIELSGNESGVLTKLAGKYDRLDKAIKLMGVKKNELNANIKAKVEDLFAAEDVVLTRVIETVSFTMTISKKSKTDDKTVVDYETIAKELAKLIPDDLQAKVEEITKAYTVISTQPDKSPALSVKAKVNEGLIGDLKAVVVSMVKRAIKSITSWAIKYDKKLLALKKIAQV